MYRRGPRNRSIGGKMLKTFIILFTLFVSLSAFACWKAEGTFAVDGETWKFNQKFDHNKEYSFPMGTFILNLKLVPLKGGMSTLVYSASEKKGTKLTLVTKGEEEEIKPGTEREIYAKGEEGQPNSIITIKLTNI